MISDCAMPIMGGIELSRKVRADPITCKTPILLMSESRQSDAARGADYDAFIKKPFLADAFISQVRVLMSDVKTGGAAN